LLDKGDNIFNVGYSKGSSVLDVVNAVEDVTGIEIKRNFVDRRPGDIGTSIADNKKILKFTGWEPRYNDLKLMIKNEWEWRKMLNK